MASTGPKISRELMMLLQRLRQVAVRTQIVKLEIMGKLMDDIKYGKPITKMLLSPPNTTHHRYIKEKNGNIQKKVLSQRNILNKSCRAIWIDMLLRPD